MVSTVYNSILYPPSHIPPVAGWVSRTTKPIPKASVRSLLTQRKSMTSLPWFSGVRPRAGWHYKVLLAIFSSGKNGAESERSIASSMQVAERTAKTAGRTAVVVVAFVVVVVVVALVVAVGVVVVVVVAVVAVRPVEKF